MSDFKPGETDTVFRNPAVDSRVTTDPGFLNADRRNTRLGVENRSEKQETPSIQTIRRSTKWQLKKKSESDSKATITIW